MLETERLLLRKPRVEDADDLVESIGDEEVARWIGGQSGDRVWAAETVERWLARWEANGVGHFSVELEGRVIGRVGFLVWDRRTWQVSSYADAGTAAETELGWAISRRQWGKGYATEAARALRSWAYAERGVERLISLIDPANARSARVAEKLGAAPTETVEIEQSPAVVWLHPRSAQD